MKKNNSKINFVFFGTSDFSCRVLEELSAAGFVPSLILTTEDKPSGRKLALTSPPAKVWAEKHSVPFFQPENLHDPAVREKLISCGASIFIVASYGKIIPVKILEIPPHGTLNVHPSLLPKLRGATPIQSAILGENETGITIMLVDEKMDHGPVILQEKVRIKNWPPHAQELKETLAAHGGKLLTKIIPGWIAGKVKPHEQNHKEATYTKKITKEDGLINLSDPAELNLRKIRAYEGWPTAYFFHEKGDKKMRIVIKDAEINSDGKLKILKVIPEGKKEMPYEDFLRGIKDMHEQ